MAICLLDVDAAIKSMFRLTVKYFLQLLSDFNGMDVNIGHEQQNIIILKGEDYQIVTNISREECW